MKTKTLSGTPVFMTRDISPSDKISRLYLLDPTKLPTSIYDIKPEKHIIIEGVEL